VHAYSINRGKVRGRLELTMDNPIESFEYYDFRPPNSQNFNEPGAEFHIAAFSEDIITQPSKSLLLLNGILTIQKKRASGSEGAPLSYEEAQVNYDHVHFVNNGPLHLFDRIDYYIGDSKVDSMRKPGYSTLMKGLVSFNRDIRYNTAGWKINSTSHENIFKYNHNVHRLHWE
jgi:hypothetical protein